MASALSLATKSPASRRRRSSARKKTGGTSMTGRKANYVHAASQKLGTGILAGVAYEMGHNMAIGGPAGGGAKTATFGRDVYVSGLSGR